MNKRSHANSIPLRILSAVVALVVIVAGCGLSGSEIDARLDALRTEPVLTTPPPNATMIGEFEREPISTGLGSIRSSGVVMTIWATTASLEELEDWYTSTFEGKYDFFEASGSDASRGLITLADRSTPGGNSMQVRIATGELTTKPPFEGQTYNQQTHPGMTFVAAQVGER